MNLCLNLRIRNSLLKWPKIVKKMFNDLFFGCLLFFPRKCQYGCSKNPFWGAKIVSKLRYLNICFYPLLPSCNLWLCYGISAPCYPVLFHFLPTVRSLLKPFQICAGSKRFEKVWITNVEPGAGKGWADRFEKFEKVWKVWKVANKVCKLENEVFRVFRTKLVLWLYRVFVRTATPWTLQNKAFYIIVCHIYGPFGPIRSNLRHNMSQSVA